ncbi:MAG: hypothetical protein AB1646_05805 [Thermodesulfobacteriota bacterium]
MTGWFLAHADIVGALASVAGIVLGLPALVMALIQLRRTKKAA